MEGCTNKSASADGEGILNNFNRNVTTRSYIATDKETKVQYLIVENSDVSRGIATTPRLSPNGKLMIDGE